MNINDVKELINQFDESSLREFSWKNSDDELIFSKNNEKTITQATSEASSIPANYDEKMVSVIEEPSKLVEGEMISSPLVGVVYLAPAVEKPAFVKIGDFVKKGQTLLIIEAMKVMNEIPAPKDGVITEIFVHTNEVVDFGKDLMKIS